MPATTWRTYRPNNIGFGERCDPTGITCKEDANCTCSDWAGKACVDDVPKKNKLITGKLKCKLEARVAEKRAGLTDARREEKQKQKHLEAVWIHNCTHDESEDDAPGGEDGQDIYEAAWWNTVRTELGNTHRTGFLLTIGGFSSSRRCITRWKRKRA